MSETSKRPDQQTLIERQLEREDQQVSLGIDRYYKHVASVSQSETGPGQDLAFRAVSKTAAGIEEMVAAVEAGKAGRGKPAAVTEYLRSIEPVPAAYITARCCINAMAQRARAQTCAMQIATQIEEHFQFDQLASAEPGLENTMRRKAEKWTKGRVRRFIMRIGVKIAGVRGLEWKQGDRLRLGMKLIEIFVEQTGFAELVSVNVGYKQRATVLTPTPATEEWIKEENRKQSLNHPRFLPMLVPPRDWRTPLEGGYYTQQNRINFIGGAQAGLRDDLFSTDLTEVYSAVNAVQSTAWRVNRGVFEVLAEVWRSGTTLGGVPDCDDVPMPERPPDFPPLEVKLDDIEDEGMKARIKAHKAATRAAAELNASLISQRLALATQINMASDHLDEREFYFPHNLDFRGRIYSVVAGLNPQGDDTGKALIEFAEGKPLGMSGGYWLAVHIANLFGVDKVSFNERVEWVKENEQAILDSAANPLDGERFWCEADYPYCALAACFEWAGYLTQGEHYVSHLPIAMDGSCSGLQHFSAMLRDTEGAAAVNLVPLEQPADIYTVVAERAAELVEQSDDPLKNAWAGKITRKIAKRPCMTFAYSVTSRGMRDQILDEMRKQADGGNYLSGVENWEGANFLAPFIEQAIKDTVNRAAEAMDWLQESVREFFAGLRDHLTDGVTEASIPVNWTTPDGFPAQQRYAKMNGKRYKVWFQGKRMDIQLRTESSRADTRKQVSGIAPNFVHSMDACHLRRVVNRLVDEELTNSFAVIHDSFGVHACDVDELHAVIRDEFIQLYTDDVLSAFRNEQSNYLPQVDFPPVPAAGELDLEEVRDADFFFS